MLPASCHRVPTRDSVFSLLELCGSYHCFKTHTHTHTHTDTHTDTVCVSLFTFLSKQQVTYYIYVGVWPMRKIKVYME